MTRLEGAKNMASRTVLQTLQRAPAEDTKPDNTPVPWPVSLLEPQAGRDRAQALAAAIINLHLAALKKTMQDELATPDYTIRQATAMFIVTRLPKLAWRPRQWWNPLTWKGGRWRLS